MKTYSVFEPTVRPGSPVEDAQSLVFVRHGWSLAALFVPMVWMLMRRLWWVLLTYVVLIIAIQVLSYAISPVYTAGLSVALALVIMIEAGQLRLESMAAKGYREIAVINAKNQADAEHQFFTHWLNNPSGTVPARAPEPPAGSHTQPKPTSAVLRPSSAKPPALPGLPS